MEGKICIVTGANTGIGKETALGLAQKGAEVIMLCRNMQKGVAAKEEIINKTGNENIHLIITDLASFKSVHQAIETIKKNYKKIDVLINNAGAYFTEFALTEDGNERQFQVNHLSGFLLTLSLLDLLKAAEAARIINVSSIGNYKGDIHFDDLNLTNSYNGLKAYRQSKLSNVLFTYELARRLSDTNITVNTLHPGVVGTQIGYANNRTFHALAWKIGSYFMINSKDGAATTLYLATSEEVEGITAKYFEKCKAKRSAEKSYDKELATKLWEVSEKICGIKKEADI
ncbi:SDR family oxidoreductase [Chondrinema litorale]|uniref:SDR family oxidoreductase n=1 Tax=Chondrinema litorale TaxID=2994555 RepID=UPI002543F478|nr:SDR family oxidoreductase [Chondrinema litorale]UZR94643.1 SDR family oxidoreductase [Chondrinema litorale]